MALSAMVRRLLGNALVSTSGAKELADAIDVASSGPVLVGNNNWIGVNTFSGTITMNSGVAATSQFLAASGINLFKFIGAIEFSNLSTFGVGFIKLGVDPADAVSFHGAAPVARRANAAQMPVVTTAPTNVSPYGFTQAQATAILTLLNELQAALVEKGLIKGSA